MYVGDEVHWLIGMKGHVTEAKFYLDAQLATDGTNDASQSDRLATANVEDISSRQGSLFEYQTHGLCNILNCAEVAYLGASRHAKRFAF
jgi:hypothetical protein